MKKLSPPTESRQEVLKHDISTSKPRPTKIKALHKMKSLKKISESYKVHNQAQLFIDKIKLDLEQYDDEDLELNYNVLCDVRNKAIKHIVYGNKEERDEAIEFSVKELMTMQTITIQIKYV